MLSPATRARARADAKAYGDEVASTFLADASELDRVLVDVEREALHIARPREPRVGPAALVSTLAGVAAAHAAGDEIALRGELVTLAAQSSEWASRLGTRSGYDGPSSAC